MNPKLKTFLICVAIPLLVGGAAALITSSSMDTFENLNKPPLSPPGYLFPIVWTILYILMGIASYLVVTSDAEAQDKNNALILYGLQLAANFIWPILFFSFGWYLLSFAWLIVLWVLILFTTVSFFRISKPAGILMIPYILWVIFAGYLNFGIYFLN